MKKLEREKIREIRKYRGKTSAEIATLTGVGINTVCKYMRDKRTEKNWSNRDLQRMCDWRAEGVSYDKIGQKLHRSGNSVRIKMCRYRKSVMEDPKKRIALHWIVKAFRLEQNPTLALRALRKARIFEMGVDLK